MSESEGPARRVGRPRTAVLSHERILEAAFELADANGPEFSLASLARRLGVQPSALHHYFPTKAALIAAMRGQITLRLGTHGFDEQPWHEAILPWARASIEAFGRHPGLIAALATLPIDGEPESIADYERIVAAFERDGYPSDLIVPALVALESFIIGSALDGLTPPDNLRPVHEPERAPALLRTEAAGRAAASAAGITPAQRTFEFGLRALVAGLRAIGETGGEAGGAGAAAPPSREISG